MIARDPWARRSKVIPKGRAIASTPVKATCSRERATAARGPAAHLGDLASRGLQKSHPAPLGGSSAGLGFPGGESIRVEISLWLRSFQCQRNLRATPPDQSCREPTGSEWIWRIPDSQSRQRVSNGFCGEIHYPEVIFSRKRPRDSRTGVTARVLHNPLSASRPRHKKPTSNRRA